jgi:hypothetical protein
MDIENKIQNRILELNLENQQRILKERLDSINESEKIFNQCNFLLVIDNLAKYNKSCLVTFKNNNSVISKEKCEIYKRQFENKIKEETLRFECVSSLEPIYDCLLYVYRNKN